MLNPQLEITLLLVAVAAACALPGAFLLLRRLSLVSDAISHVMLFGIVATYFAVKDLDSPWLPVGAAVTGVLTVALVEALQRTRLVKADAAVGLVFPALFALGALLASLYLRNTHLDVDSVLLGHPELSVGRRWGVGGVRLMPAVVMAGVAAANAGLIALFYKELKLATFDPALAAALGFLPGVLHYGLMGLVSVTAVAAFDSVGPVLVVAFFIVPAATAYLLTDRLWVLLGLSAAIGAAGAAGGVWLALRPAVDTNTAGTVSTVLGAMFGLAFVFAPGRGVLARAALRRRQRRRFLEATVAIHLWQHEGTPEEVDEARFDGLGEHLGWDAGAVRRVVGRAERRGLVRRDGALLKLTERGRSTARDVLGA